MIYYILPNYINNQKLDEYILNNCQQKNIVFWGVDISFNYSSWNGGINNNNNYFQTLNDYLKLKTLINIPPLRINCANIKLNSVDYYDEHMNLILSILEDYNNTIEIADLNLMQYIQKQYPKFNFTLSDNFFINYSLNDISENDFELIKIPYHKLELIQNIKNKNKIELKINPLCQNCINIEKCISMENTCQILYSNFSPIQNCQKNIKEKQFQTILDINKYINLGITHFSFNDFNYAFDMNFLSFLLKYFFTDTNILFKYFNTGESNHD